MWQLDTSPISYFPDFYDGILEFERIGVAENAIFVEALGHLNDLWKNSFVATCNEHGLSEYERILGIIANPTTEDFDFRKTRVLNRFAMIPAFTMPWLRAKLDELLGEGNWSYTLDFENMQLIVNTITKSDVWLHEVTVTINNIKPANLVFISRPLQSSTIKIINGVAKQIRTDHYKLGSWSLGKTPFTEFSAEEGVSLANTQTVKPVLLEKLAKFTLDDVSYVLVNDTLRLNKADFLEAKSSANLISLEYEVFASEGLGQINNVKIKDAFNQTLVEMDMSVDNFFNVRLHHDIRLEEAIDE